MAPPAPTQLVIQSQILAVPADDDGIGQRPARVQNCRRPVVYGNPPASLQLTGIAKGLDAILFQEHVRLVVAADRNQHAGHRLIEYHEIRSARQDKSLNKFAGDFQFAQ